jgi:hypothetical protein
MHVDDFHALASDKNFPSLHGCSRRGRTALQGGFSERVSRQ